MRDLRIMLRNIRDLFYFSLGVLQSIWLLAWWRPQVVFAKGGFVCLPVGLAAALLRIPLVTHDSDTVPGLTNRVLSRYARFMAVAMPEQYYSYPKERIRYTGLPIRAEFVAVTQEIQKHARRTLNIPESAFVVAVFGGSLGAVRLNDAIVAIAQQFLAKGSQHWLLHQTGKSQYDNVVSSYDAIPPVDRGRIRVWSFVDDSHVVTAAADVVVSRAGSSALELGVQKKAAILVPNPVLTGGHQTINARVLADQNAVVVVSEKEITDTNNLALLDAITYLEQHPEKRKVLSDNLHTLAKPNAAANIVKVLKEAM